MALNSFLLFLVLLEPGIELFNHQREAESKKSHSFIGLHRTSTSDWQTPATN